MAEAMRVAWSLISQSPWIVGQQAQTASSGTESGSSINHTWLSTITTASSGSISMTPDVLDCRGTEKAQGGQGDFEAEFTFFSTDGGRCGDGDIQGGGRR